ncbi:hypothetical protein CK203_070540 [Vitis vinifera]|uniref:Metallothionein-like protein n=1 Tax=Vitis vinifera TaxID=29760 RepID=A0A438FAW4_VITVI|nr:hypothetical protein CK203_070540 [Vitis vinifera]
MSGCGCGSSCGCGSDCKCGKMYPDLGSSEKATTAVTIITGVAPVKMHSEGSETSLEGGKAASLEMPASAEITATAIHATAKAFVRRWERCLKYLWSI